MRIRENLKKILLGICRHLLILMAGALLGLFALFLVYCIPTDRMQLHIWQSMELIESEFASDRLLESCPATMTGNFTDCLMLEHTIYKSSTHSLLEQMLYMYRGESGEGEGWAPGFSLSDYLNNLPQEREVEYARYWHGYLVFLKPLFCFMTLPAWRMLSAALQMLLAGLVAMLCARRGGKVLGIGFLAALPFLYFFTLYSSLSLSICFYLTAIAMCVQLTFHEKLLKGGYSLFFLICGMCTSYFDFLTYPLVTLGFPLCVFLYLYRGSPSDSVKRLAGCSAEWGIGYLGLWALKWFLTDILTGGSTIRDGLLTVLTRTGAASAGSRLSGFFEVAGLNLSAFVNWGFYPVFAALLAGCVFCLFRGRKRLSRDSILNGAVLFLVCLFPFIWWFGAQNHSQQHWMFTCKIFSITVFALVCGVGRMVRDERKGNP